MIDQTITIVGARGGSGASAVASAVALFASRTVTTELVAADLDSAAALLGIGGPTTLDTPIDVADGLALASTTTDAAQVVVVDAGRLEQLTDPPAGLVLMVLRGPCYLGLRSIVASGLQADGIVLVVEAGRSLTRRDVGDVCGVPVVAEIPVTANVARTIDAGLLISRLPALRDFADLRTYIDATINLTEPQRAARERHPSSRSAQSSRATSTSSVTASSNPDPLPRDTPSKIDTDMPVALCATSRALRSTRFGRSTRHSLLKRDCWRDRVEHREVESGRHGVLRR
jgi:hypothetical protein